MLAVKIPHLVQNARIRHKLTRYALRIPLAHDCPLHAALRRSSGGILYITGDTVHKTIHLGTGLTFDIDAAVKGAVGNIAANAEQRSHHAADDTLISEGAFIDLVPQRLVRGVSLGDLFSALA